MQIYIFKISEFYWGKVSKYNMCSQEDGNGDFWNEDESLSFPSLKSVHVD